jgi:hypothetical protein
VQPEDGATPAHPLRQGRRPAAISPVRERGDDPDVQAFINASLAEPPAHTVLSVEFDLVRGGGRTSSLQIAIMGATALAFAAVSDSAYALLAGRAGRLLARHRVRLMSQLSSGCLIGGGLWLASARTR